MDDPSIITMDAVTAELCRLQEVRKVPLPTRRGPRTAYVSEQTLRDHEAWPLPKFQMADGYRYPFVVVDNAMERGTLRYRTAFNPEDCQACGHPADRHFLAGGPCCHDGCPAFITA